MGHDGHAVREKHPFCIVIQQSAQRLSHLLEIGAVLRREKSETVGFKVDQGVPHNERAVFGWRVKGDLAWSGAVDGNNFDCIQNSFAM